MKQKLQTWLPALPAVIIMCIIFAFSSAEARESSGSSTGFSRFLVRTESFLFGKHWDEEEILFYAEKIEGGVRKCAHITEYMALALSVGFFLMTRKLNELRVVFYSVLFSVLYAASDEFHQLFVAGRSGKSADVVIDSLGAVFGVMLLILINESRVRKGIR
ncbi:MAG: VanZ family protein [Lachnospiraceae bacterium]|nr:VanZ family protein [Lachnospiraceae bacterium]